MAFGQHDHQGIKVDAFKFAPEKRAAAARNERILQTDWYYAPRSDEVLDETLSMNKTFGSIV